MGDGLGDPWTHESYYDMLDVGCGCDQNKPDYAFADLQCHGLIWAGG